MHNFHNLDHNNKMSKDNKNNISEMKNECNELNRGTGSVFSYFYYSNREEPFFEVEANGILEADEMLKEATGIIAEKTSKVGCRISFKQHR